MTMGMSNCQNFSIIKLMIWIITLELVHGNLPWPFCQDQGVIFVSQPGDVILTCRENDVAVFPCQYTGTSTHPQWVINSSLYGPVNQYFPPDHSYDNNMLTVTNLRSKNGSLYQCVLFSRDRCVYGSTVAQLICKDVIVHCMPHYHYESAILTAIRTTITQGDNSERIYNVSYLNSDSGDGCDSVNLTCNHGVCHHMFQTATSNCHNDIMSNITVTVIVSAFTDTINPMPDPIMIDGTNNFVRIFITPTSFSCTFINQSEESEKFCAINYGPATPGCTNLTSDYLKSKKFMGDSSAEILFDDPADGNICFTVRAGSGTQNVTIEGKSLLTEYASCTQHYISEPTIAALISLCILAYSTL